MSAIPVISYGATRMRPTLRLSTAMEGDDGHPHGGSCRDRFLGRGWPERIGPVTPGDVLREGFMAPLGLSARASARELGVPSNRITAILAGDVTAETAILLGE